MCPKPNTHALLCPCPRLTKVSAAMPVPGPETTGPPSLPGSETGLPTSLYGVRTQRGETPTASRRPARLPTPPNAARTSPALRCLHAGPLPAPLKRPLAETPSLSPQAKEPCAAPSSARHPSPFSILPCSERCSPTSGLIVRFTQPLWDARPPEDEDFASLMESRPMHQRCLAYN